MHRPGSGYRRNACVFCPLRATFVAVLIFLVLRVGMDLCGSRMARQGVNNTGQRKDYTVSVCVYAGENYTCLPGCRVGDRCPAPDQFRGAAITGMTLRGALGPGACASGQFEGCFYDWSIAVN